MIDPKNKLDRTLMFIPGFLTWMMLLMPVWLGITAPKIASFILTFLSIYWIYMALTHAIGLIKGYKRYKKEVEINWYEKCKKLDFKKLPNHETLPENLDKTKHLLLIPTVNESFEILNDSIGAITKANYPMENIVLAIGTEEIGRDQVSDVIRRLKEKYGEKLPRILHYIHPKGIPGEIVGVASPNRAWAAKHAVEQLKKEGENMNNYIFTTFDSDWRLHPEFLPRVAYEYLTDAKRFNRFYETVVHLFSNNIWDVPILSRIEANNVTLGVLSNWSSGQLFATPKETFTCYSCALDTLITSEYWDTRFIDDTVFYWRAFKARKGDFGDRHFYIPIYGDATGGSNLLTAYKNLYKQLVRWGWGSVTTVMAIKAILAHADNKSSLSDRIMWIYSKVERHLFMRTAVFLITFGFSIITLVNAAFKNSSTVYGLPQLMSIILTGGLLMFIPATYIRLKLYENHLPKNFTKVKRILMWLEGPVVGINLLTYSFIPFVYAETMMMLGKLPKVTFYTPKTR